MRATELTVDSDGKLTLRAVNRMKRERRKRDRAFARKAPLIRAMYGNEDTLRAQEELDHQRELLRQEAEAARRELEIQRLEIEREIAQAKLDSKAREKITDLANRTIRNRRFQSK